jgi:peptide/nickel transport system permease protein
MPFAHTAYAKEMAVNSEGKSQWHYPRLLFAGSHLADPENEKSADINNKIRTGVGWAILAWLLLVLLIKLISGRQPFTREASGFKVCLLTLLGVFLWLGAMANLAPYYHILGTDKVGEDVLYQAIKSIRTGLVIGSLTTIVMLPIAISLGLMAGFFRGWVDDVIQYLYTTLSSIPGVLLIAAAILMAQVYMANNPELFTTVEDRADMRLLLLCMILGVTSWTGLCRLLRAETLKIREMDYVVAAQALGVKRLQLLKRHVLPNVMHLVMITVVLDFSGLVLAEAVLSYINIGVDPSTYSWGNMINTSRLEMAREPIVWWSLAASFIFMFTLVLAANLFADVVRDAFDPRSNN